jgi:hypothetical protein
MAVSRNERSTQSDMTALQSLANSKPIAGKPYNFGANAHWVTELERLRTNLFKYWQIDQFPYESYFPYNPEIIVSGPWARDVRGQGLRISSEFLRTNVFETRGQVPNYDFVSYLFPASTSPSIGLEMVLVDYQNGQEFPYFKGIVDPRPNVATGSEPEIKLKFDLRTDGLIGRFSGNANFGFESPISASQYQATGSGGVQFQLVNNNRHLIAYWDFVTADLDFEIKVARLAGAPKGFCFGFGISSGTATGVPSQYRLVPVKWTHTISAASAYPGIHSTSGVRQITLPRTYRDAASLPKFGAFHPDGRSSNYIVTETFRKYFQNQALLRATPSASIINTGIWKAKMIPIVGGLHAGDFNPNANEPTVDTEEFGQISRACEGQIPAYHWVRDTDALAAPPITQATGAGYGWIINEVFIVRNPEEDGDYYLPNTDEAVTVELGCMRNGSFVSFESVTIAVGEASTYIYPFWPIFTRDYLVYRCSVPMQIYARVVAAIAGDSQDAARADRGPSIDYPILASHYNDTEAMLQAIP